MGYTYANFNAKAFNKLLAHIRASVNSCGLIQVAFFTKSLMWHKALYCWVTHSVCLLGGY